MKKRAMKLFKILILLTLAISCCYCNNNGNNTIQNDKLSSFREMEFAQFYNIESDSTSIKEICIRNVWSGKEKFDHYKLVPRDCTALLMKDKYTIPYPIKNVICMSSSHVAFLTSLGMEESISGISGTRFICNERVKNLIEENKIVDIGSEEVPNYEKIISLKPDLVFAYGITGNSNSYIEKLQMYGIKVMVLGEYLENTPLGKMEYIKLFGLLTERKEMADSIFNSGLNAYLETKESIKESIEKSGKSKVLINLPYKGSWMIPGEHNYITNLIEDAGGVILGAGKGVSHATQYSFEQIYNYALQADVWLHTNMINTRNELEKANPLYKNIPAFKNGLVYNNTLITTAAGGSAFWETGCVEPHIILKDLTQILHPGSNGESKFKYYRKLQ